MTVLVVGVSDLHIVSTLGLCPLYVPLDDGGTYTATQAQRWLWSKWEEAWAEIKRLKRKHRAELWTVINGDIVDGDHHNTYQLVSRNPATMLDMALTILEPVARMSSRLFVVRGTETHVGGSGAWEEKIASDLGAEPDPDTGRASWWVCRLDAEGVGFEFAHHGRMGGRPWTSPNALNALAVETMIAYDGAAWRPNIVVRSHYHRYASTGDNYPVQVVALPAWQLATGFVRRIAPQSIADIGMVAWVCHRGQYDQHVIRYHPARGSVWRSPKRQS